VRSGGIPQRKEKRADNGVRLRFVKRRQKITERGSEILQHFC